jgi:Ca-activated chloride channel family protein
MTSRHVLTALLAGSVLSGSPAAQEAPPFRASVGVVVLPTIVKNGRGVLVTDLDRNAFTVFENGKPQSITLFSRDDVPVSLGLLIDNSGSMRSIRSRVEEAALALVTNSNPQDEVFVVNFADKPRLDVPFTSDLRTVQAGAARVDAIGGTALYDAVDMAQTYLREHASRDRKVLVVITDGNDNASVTTLARVQDTLAQDAIAVYGVGLFRDETTMHRGRRELDLLTKRTGGVAYYPDIGQIHATALEIARQVRNQYTIVYKPTNQTLDGSYRAIRVQVRAPEHLTVLTRQGYRATAGSTTPTPQPRPTVTPAP